MVKKQNWKWQTELPELTIEDMIDYFQKFENINQLPTIDNIFDDLGEKYEDVGEIFYDNVFGRKGISFMTADKTKVTLTHGGQCILHSYLDIRNGDAGAYIYEIDDNSFICATCLARLQEKPEEIEIDCSDDYYFPYGWTVGKIKKWYEKKEQRGREYSEKRAERYQARLQEEMRLKEGYLCLDCEHMKRGECEFGMDDENACDYYSPRY